MTNHSDIEKLKALGYTAKQVFIPYTNSDCTEGRGYQIPLCVCESKTTALRKGKGRSVQGSDCHIRDLFAVKIDGLWYAPTHIEIPNSSDIDEDVERAKIEIIKKKMQTAGISEEDIKLITKNEKS